MPDKNKINETLDELNNFLTSGEASVKIHVERLKEIHKEISSNTELMHTVWVFADGAQKMAGYDQSKIFDVAMKLLVILYDGGLINFKEKTT